MKSLLVLQGFHELRADIGLMTLAPDVAHRVTVELGWVDGIDFRSAGPPPVERDFLFVSSRERQRENS